MFKGLRRFICRAYACWLARPYIGESDFTEEMQKVTDFLLDGKTQEVEVVKCTENALIHGVDWSMKDPCKVTLTLSHKAQLVRTLPAPMTQEQYNALGKAVGEKLSDARLLFPLMLHKPTQ